MKKVSVALLVVSVILSLGIGGIAGFFLGVASTEAGKNFLAELVEEEQMADVAQPRRLDRAEFQLKYPSNWYVDVEDEDFDPDHLFSIDSPGASYVMFVMGNMEADPEETLQDQISQFEKLLTAPTINKFDRYGQLSGKGATLRGKIMGIRSTVKLFSYNEDGFTVMITQQYPDEDLKYVQDGMSLIEDSFSLKNGGMPEESAD